MCKALETMTTLELLRFRGRVDDVLREKDVVKGKNVLGDYTEWLVCKHLELERQPASTAAYDALCVPHDVRYQIKGRQSEANTVRFSPIHKLKEHNFDVLVGIVFDNRYSVRKAIKISYEAVVNLSKYQGLTNSNFVTWTPRLMDEDGVEDISGLIRQAED